MLEEGSRKVASKPSPPCLGLKLLKLIPCTIHGIFNSVYSTRNFCRGLGREKEDRPIQLWDIQLQRFSYNKGLPTFHHGINFDWTTGNRKQMVTTYLSDLYVRTFSHRKTCVTNQNISRRNNHSYQKANLSFEKKFKFLKLFSSRKPEYLVGTLLQF